MEVCEVALKLEQNLEYYKKILNDDGAINVGNYETRDIYYSNVDLNGKTEEEMKNSSVRIRMVRNLDSMDNFYQCEVQNYLLFDKTKEFRFKITEKEISKYHDLFVSKGFNRVIDTKKIDHQYKIKNMKSYIQLQEIEDVGLILYYDNPDYYDLSLEEQRKLLIKELYEYGFKFNDENKDIDKLRSIYYGELKYKFD